MTMDVTWANTEKTRLSMHIYGDVSWEEYHEAGLKVYDMTVSVPHRVDVLVTAEVDVPPGNPLPHIKSASLRLETADNLGYCISIVPSTLTVVRALMSMLYRIYGISHKFRIVGSYEEADRLIADAIGHDNDHGQAAYK